MTLIVLVVSASLVDQYLRRQDSPTSEVDLGAAAAALAAGVTTKTQAQEHHWQVHDPYPIPVRWSVGPAELADHWTNVRRAGPLDESRPLPLAGQLEQITSVYRQIPSGRLVILGQPGAGKTILAGRLAAGLLVTNPPERVPVVFNLSTWNPDVTSLSAWLAARLAEDHPGLALPGRAGGTLAGDLVAADRILPILDGFDEIATGLHRAALTTLNRTTIPLVVTSRPDEYRQAIGATDVLTGAAIITLANLTTADVTDYLTRASPPAAGPRWQPVLAALTSRQRVPAAANLSHALTTPLMLYLVRVVYADSPDRDPTELLDTTCFPSPAAIEEHLLAAFIPAAYARPTGRRSRPWDGPAKALRWHTYLATHLRRLDTYDLAWWQLRATIPRAARVLAMGLTVGLAGGLAVGLAVGLSVGLEFGLEFGLSGALAAALARGH